jgi:diguanylate cyclase (GGDEF)-like protein
MKLRFLSALCTASVTLTIVIVALVLGHKIVTRAYLDLEAAQLESDLQRSTGLLRSEGGSLDVAARDRAASDGTWSYMQSRDPAYIRSAFSPIKLRNLNVRMAMLVGPAGEIVYSGSLAGVDPGPDQQLLLQVLRKSVPPPEGLSGVLIFSDGPVLVAARRILHSDGRGPQRGTLILARDVDYRFIAHLSSLVGAPLLLQAIDRAADLGSRTAPPLLTPGKATWTETLDEDRAVAFAKLDDMLGRPRLLLRIEHDRAIWKQGKRQQRLLLWLMVALGIVQGAANLWLMQHYIVGRIEKLTRFAAGVNTEAGLRQRIALSGHDQIATLGETLNRMLDQLQCSHEQMLAAGERLQFEATHDALTGAWNRAAGMDLLDRELDRSSRAGIQVAVILLDLDRFKDVNDRYGHAAGDAVLKHFTATIARNLRSFDVLVRYGGEEFLIIAPNCGVVEARVLTERLQHSLRSVAIPVGGNFIHVTASAGVTAGASPLTSEELIAVADCAMYRAKAKGRDCAHYEEMKAGGSVRGQLFMLPGHY